MRRFGGVALALLGMAGLAGWLLQVEWASASSYTFQCRGERIEKGQSTWGYARSSGDDVRIETTTQSLGYAVKRGDKWGIESFGRSGLAWLVGDRIEHFNGSTWTSLDTARQFARCNDQVAAALWVLNEKGKL